MTEEKNKTYKDFLAAGGEEKWQKKWAKADLHRAEIAGKKKKKYILDMFPYPSGAGLHVGHVESYTATDIYSRYLRMNGFNVLHPQGWDAFGLPAENYAIKTGVHPRQTTEGAISTFKRQINSLGFSYDWNREVRTSDPGYYRWTQWFFLFLYKNGLAYKKKAKVNWCGHCQTVLANEQAEGGKCERCGHAVVQKDLEQWFFRITDFIEDQDYPPRPESSGHPLPAGRQAPREGTGRKIAGLLSGLDGLDWPESTKAAQKNWIGRSEGAMVKFRVIARSVATKQTRGKSDKGGIASPRSVGARNDSEGLEVFTTRPDTLFGATYMVVCPEHVLITNNESRINNYGDVKKYIEQSKKKTELERTDLAKEKTGVRLEGLLAVNPVNNEEIPIFVADYVLSGYGTGAIMAVPAHDERDWEFAQTQNTKHGTRNIDGKIKIIPVVVPDEEKIKKIIGVDTVEYQKKLLAEWGLEKLEYVEEIKSGKRYFTRDGIAINSDFLNGLITPEAKKRMIAWLEEKRLGKRAVNYKLRDWLVSRQRYWGAPIPIVYCDVCGEVPVPEGNLPVLLPDDVDFKPTGESPLKYSKKFHDIKCPKCGAPARRESDTMDTFVCSSWYYMRYADPKNKKEFAGEEALKKWLPVDVYLGGAEHTVLHLLYSRFFTKALQKYGYIDFNEPFTKLRHQGIILAEDGNKMSKSKGNVINPDDVVERYGADALRMYEMFMGPLEDAKPWSTKGIIGISRFLEKVWKLAARNTKHETRNTKPEILLHKTIKKVTEDIEAFKFNTAISQMMIFVNDLEKKKEINPEEWKKFLIILSPFAPHLAEELWAEIGHKESIFKEEWPEYDRKLVIDETFNLAVQINGKLRDTIAVAADISEDDAKGAALGSEKVKKWLEGKEVVKIIYVKGRLVSVVVK